MEVTDSDYYDLLLQEEDEWTTIQKMSDGQISTLDDSPLDGADEEFNHFLSQILAKVNHHHHHHHWHQSEGNDNKHVSKKIVVNNSCSRPSSLKDMHKRGLMLNQEMPCTFVDRLLKQQHQQQQQEQHKNANHRRQQQQRNRRPHLMTRLFDIHTWIVTALLIIHVFLFVFRC